MQINNVSNAERFEQVMPEFSFEMNPEEKSALSMAVDTINKQTFAGVRMPKQELGKDDFLQLLIAQLTHQDPTAPLNDTEFIGQMAQFSSLEQMTNMNLSFSKVSEMLSGSSASSAVGKRVDVEEGSNVVSGYITAVKCGGSSPEVMVSGKWYNWSLVQTIYAE